MTKLDPLNPRFPHWMPPQQLRAQVSIIELAIHHGYQLQPHKGKGRPVLVHPAHQDTIIIKNPHHPAHQLYQRAGQFTDAGTLFDFVRNRLPTVFARFNQPTQHPFTNITSVLYDYLHALPLTTTRPPTHPIATPLAQASPRPGFDPEQFDLRPLPLFNYLTQRHITPATLQRPEFVGKVLAQVAYFNPLTQRIDSFSTAKAHPQRPYRQFTNVAFPYANSQSGAITGLELRNQSLKQHAPGSDRSASVFVSNAPPKVLAFYVMESAIDALSHQQIRSLSGDEDFNAVYFSTGGQLTPQQIVTIAGLIMGLDKQPNWQIKLAFDNDLNGCRFDLLFIEHLVSTILPLQQSSRSGGNRCCYELAEPNAHQPLQQALLSWVEGYNQTRPAPLARTNPNGLSQAKPNDPRILISWSDNPIGLSIPWSCQALTAFGQALLVLTGLDQRVMLTKAQGKDFNEDLTRAVESAAG